MSKTFQHTDKKSSTTKQVAAAANLSKGTSSLPAVSAVRKNQVTAFQAQSDHFPGIDSITQLVPSQTIVQRIPEAVPNTSHYKDDNIPGRTLDLIATEAGGSLKVFKVIETSTFFCYVNEKYYTYDPPRKQIDPATLVNPAPPKPKSLLEMMEGFEDLALTKNGEMELSVTFGPISEDDHAVTSVWMNGVKVVPQQFMIPANKNKTWKITIVLSDDMYKSGQKEELLGDLYATLAHEWELHGRQHAINIHELKQDRLPATLIGHGAFFDLATNGLDRNIAKLTKENKPLRDDILKSYFQDAESHVKFNLKGWVAGDNGNAKSCMREIKALVSSYKMLKQIPPEGIPQTAYESLLTKFFRDTFADPYFMAYKESEVTVETIISKMGMLPLDIYPTLINIYSTPIPGDVYDMYATARESLLPNFKTLLLYFSGLVDAHKTIVGAGKHPRETAMKGLL